MAAYGNRGRRRLQRGTFQLLTSVCMSEVLVSNRVNDTSHSCNVMEFLRRNEMRRRTVSVSEFEPTNTRGTYRRTRCVAVELPHLQHVPLVSSSSQRLHQTSEGGRDVNVDATSLDGTIFDISKEFSEEGPLPITKLDCPANMVNRIILLPKQKLLVAASELWDVYMLGIDTPGRALTIFKEHSCQFPDFAQLERNLVVSVGEDNMLYSWLAACAELDDKWKHSAGLTGVMKVDEHKLIISGIHGKLMALRIELGM